MQKRTILHNIRSAHNVGSIFRTADGAGVEKIYLSGHTPQPVDRFGRAQNEIKKTSLGASDMVAWRAMSDIVETITILKKEGWTIAAVEQDRRSISIYEYIVPSKIVYIFGNEVEGIPAELLENSDVIIEIPMSGKKESLNVSVAAGIVLFKQQN